MISVTYLALKVCTVTLPGRLKIGRTNWLDPVYRLRELSKDTGAADNLSLCYSAVFENPSGAETNIGDQYDLDNKIIFVDHR